MQKKIILNTNKIDPKFDLTNKKVFITGAAGDIGKAIWLRLQNHGAKIFGTCLKSSELFNLSPNINIIKTNITNEKQVKKIFNSNINFDYLIHCAGYIKPEPILFSTSRKWIKQIDTNLIGSYFILKHFFINNCTNGVAITISSSSGFEGRENWSAYCASKAGLISLVESLNKELYKNCSIYDIAPSRVATKMRKILFPKEDQINMQKPEDIAKLVHQILSDKLKKYKGKSLHIENKNVKLWRKYET